MNEAYLPCGHNAVYYTLSIYLLSIHPQSFSTLSPAEPPSSSPLTSSFPMLSIPSLRASKSGHGLHQQPAMPRRANTHPGRTRPKATSACLPYSFFNANLLIPTRRQTPPSLTIRTSHASSEPSDSTSSRTVMLHSTQHRWSELVPPQTALTFVAVYDPKDGLLTFSGASLLPSEPPTPPTPNTPSSPLDTPDTPATTAFSPMPCTPAPSTLADMQSLLDAYFRSAAPTATSNNNAVPARASSTFDGLRCGCIPPKESGSTKAGAGVGAGREKPLPVRPPPPPDRDSVFAWSWLGHMAPDEPCESGDASIKDCGGGCVYGPSAADSGYVSEGCGRTACDGDDGDSFYFTPPEMEDPNEVREVALHGIFLLFYLSPLFPYIR